MKLDLFKKNISKVIDEYILNQRRDQSLHQSRFRASGITDCPRAILFSMMSLPTDKYPRAKNDTAKGYKLMRQGTAIHEIVQEYLEGMGVLKEEDKEKVIKDDEYLFVGHCDGVLTFDEKRVLLEIKTINSNAFKTLTQPKEEHFYQGQAYCYFLDKVFNDHIEDILFLYVDRNTDNLDMKAFWVQRDENVIGMITNKLKVLKEYFTKEEVYSIPPGFSPEIATFNPCNWCPFRTEQLCLSKKTKMSDFPGANIIKK